MTGNLSSIEGCVNMRTLVLSDTKVKIINICNNISMKNLKLEQVKGVLESLSNLVHLRRLNLCRSKVDYNIDKALNFMSRFLFRLLEL